MYQGVMIAHGFTKRVAIASITRVASMAVLSVLLATFTSFEGVFIGAVSLCMGVFLEAIATGIMAKPIIAELSTAAPDHELTQKEISTFYRPLALTSVAAMAINPLSSFFMTRFPYPAESMAVFPVVDSLVFQFKSSSYALQETVVSLAGKSQRDNAMLRRFSYILMAFTSGLLAMLAFSPLIMVVYTVFPFTLSPGLAAFAITPTYIFVLLPALQVWNSYLKGLMINSRLTRAVSVSTFVEVACLVGFSWVFMVGTSLSGVNATFLAFLLGRLISSLYLHYTATVASSVPAEPLSLT
jgi:hypothetical protein